MAVISLLGYMGSGKSTFGKLLAEKINYKFIDLDDVIEAKYDMSITEIFQSKGSTWFRDNETHMLNKIMRKDNIVISLGGGTPIYNDNMSLVLQKTISVYLKASVDALFFHLKDNRDKRPIIKYLNNDELKEFISTHLSEREKYYKLAKHHIITDNKNIDEIVSELSLLLS